MVVTKCLDDLPSAIVPLWQLAHGAVIRV